jgi:hypothetical protein
MFEHSRQRRDRPLPHARDAVERITAFAQRAQRGEESDRRPRISTEQLRMTLVDMPAAAVHANRVAVVIDHEVKTELGQPLEHYQRVVREQHV